MFASQATCCWLGPCPAQFQPGSRKTRAAKNYRRKSRSSGSVIIAAPAANDTPDVPDFSGRRFNAPDFALYIEQLRAFGTPEPKIREII